MKRIIAFIFLLIFISSEILARQNFYYPDISMDFVSAVDDDGESLDFATIYGATQSDEMYNRIFETGLFKENGLLDPSKREDYYVIVIRRLIYQEKFVDFDLIENGNNVTPPTQEEFDDLKASILGFVEGGVAVTDFVTSILLEGNNVPGYLQRLTLVDDVPVSNLKHFGEALSGISILFDGINIINNVDKIFATQTLMEAISLDLANRRLNYLEDNLSINDSVIENALSRVRDEIELIDNEFWGTYYSTYLQNRQEILEIYTSRLSIANTLYGLAGGTLAGYGGAILFAYDQYMLAREHRDKLREATIAATIYYNLNGNELIYTDFYLKSYALLIHLQDRRESVANWATWTLSWFSDGWEMLLEYYSNTYSSYIVSLYDYRLRYLEDKLELSNPEALIARYSASKTSGIAPLTVSFEDLSEPSDKIISWKWDFNNDGITDSQEQNPTYTYKSPGAYSVSLIVSDGNNSDQELKENYITVNEEEVVNPDLTMYFDEGPYMKDEAISVRVKTEPVTEGLKFNFSVSPYNGSIQVFNSGYTNSFGIANAEFIPNESGEYTIEATNSTRGTVRKSVSVSDEIPPIFEPSFMTGNSTQSEYNLYFEYQGFSWTNDPYTIKTDNGYFKSSGSQEYSGTMSRQTKLSQRIIINEAKNTTVWLVHGGTTYQYSFMPVLLNSSTIQPFYSVSSGRLSGVEWSKDGENFLYSNNETLNVLSTKNWKPVNSKNINNGDIGDISLSNNGNKLAYIGDDELHIVDYPELINKKSTPDINIHEQGFIKWIYDDSKLVIGSWLDVHRVYSPSLNSIQNLDLSNEILDLDYNDENRHYAVAYEGDDIINEVAIFETSGSWSIIKRLDINSSDEGASVSYSPDGKFLASASRNETIKVFNVDNNYALEFNISDDIRYIRRVEWNPNPELNYLAVSLKDNSGINKIYIYDMDSVTRVFEADAPSWMWRVKWSHDGKTLATVDDSKLQVFSPFDQVPPAINTSIPGEISSSKMKVTGNAFDASGYILINIFINDVLKESIEIEESSEFESEIDLEQGSNSIKVEAVDRFLNSNEEIFTVNRLINHEISGIVLFDESPLSEVTVSLLSSNEQVVNTGTDGSFSFNVPHKDSVSVTFAKLGYSFVPEVVGIDSLSADTIITVVATKEILTPKSPDLFTPKDNATDQNLNLTLNWENLANADNYNLKVSELEDLSSPLIEVTDIPNNKYDLVSLKRGTTYFWTVRGENSYGVGLWSDTLSFSTFANPNHVTIRELNTYQNLTEYNLDSLLAHPLVGDTVSYTGVIVSNPKSSGLAGASIITGVAQDINRIHVFITDTAAATQGRSGMSIQVVENDWELLEGFERGDVVTFTGSLGFYNDIAQMTAFTAEKKGDVNDEGSGLSKYIELLEPWEVSISDLNRINPNGTFEVNIENYTKYNASYVLLKDVVVENALQAPIPRWSLNKNGYKIFKNSTSLRFRNDRGNYLEGWNFRHIEEGEFLPPSNGSIVNMSGFVNFGPIALSGETLAEGKNAFSISPFEDGVRWVDGVKFVNGVDGFEWPEDLEILSTPELPQVNVSISNSYSGLVGNIIDIPVQVGNLNSTQIEAFEFELGFDPNKLEILSVEKGEALSNEFNLESNVIEGSIFVSSGSSVPLADSGSIVNLKVKLIGGSGQTSLIWKSFNFNEGEPVAITHNGLIEIAEFICGDVTGDSSISAMDASYVLRHTVRLSPQYPLTGQDSTAADVTGNGWVSAYDAAQILKYNVGFPAIMNCSVQTAKEKPLLATIQWSYAESNADQTLFSIPIFVRDIQGDLVSAEVKIPLSEGLEFKGLGNTPENWQVSINTIQNEVMISMLGLDGFEGDLLTELMIEVSDKTKAQSIAGQVMINENKPVQMERLSLYDLPKEFELTQNYPNPFNPTTQIKYSVPEEAEVQLMIFNLLGQKVAELVNERKVPGRYTVSWDAGNNASGVYMYRLISGENVFTKKMMLIK